MAEDDEDLMEGDMMSFFDAPKDLDDYMMPDLDHGAFEEMDDGDWEAGMVTPPSLSSVFTSSLTPVRCGSATRLLPRHRLAACLRLCCACVYIETPANLRAHSFMC